VSASSVFIDHLNLAGKTGGHSKPLINLSNLTAFGCYGTDSVPPVSPCRNRFRIGLPSDGERETAGHQC
jgi:hypothetical protein